MERARINAHLRRFGESVRYFFRSQQRSSLLSPLFHLPGRLILGGYCYYEHGVALLRERGLRRDLPEHLARRAKRLGGRPNEIHINSLLLGYLNGREQNLLLGRREREGSIEDLAFLLEFWERFLSVYRNDGRLLPEEGGFTLPVLDEETLEGIIPTLRPLEESRRRRLRRALATIDLFTFVFNGEARVGIFHHGPYGLPDGSCLVIKEQQGLQDDFYSWAEEAVRLPIAQLVCILHVRETRVRIGLFGSLWTEPREYSRNVQAYGLFAADRVGSPLRPIELEELEDVAACAARAQQHLYREFLRWDERRRLSYGAELYGNLLRVFGDEAGLGEEFYREIRERFQESVERHLEALLGGEPALILQHIATAEGPIYRPVA